MLDEILGRRSTLNLKKGKIKRQNDCFHLCFPLFFQKSRTVLNVIFQIILNEKLPEAMS